MHVYMPVRRMQQQNFTRDFLSREAYRAWRVT